jgi:hypothetical protein
LLYSCYLLGVESQKRREDKYFGVFVFDFVSFSISGYINLNSVLHKVIRYEGVTKSIRSESIKKQTTTINTVEKQYKELCRQNSQSSDTTASSGREVYHLQFSLQAANPETFGYTVISIYLIRQHTEGIEKC